MSLSFIERFQPVIRPRNRTYDGRSNKPWSADDCNLLRTSAAKGWVASRIAPEVGRSYAAVRKQAAKMGIALELEVRAVPDQEEDNPSSSPSPVRAIAIAVAERHGIPFADIIGPCREAWLASARQEAMWLAARDTKKSYPHIGRVFGRDRSTVTHAICRQNRLRNANVRGLGVDKSKPNGRKK